MDLDSAFARPDREVADLRPRAEPDAGDPETVRACFATVVAVTRRRVLSALVANPALGDVRPDDWLRRVYTHAALAFCAHEAWCDDAWLDGCIRAAARAALAAHDAPPEDLLARAAPALHPAVLDVLTDEVFGQRAPSALATPHDVPWDLALRRAIFGQLAGRWGNALDVYLRYAWGFPPPAAAETLAAAIEGAWEAFASTHPRYDFAPWLIAIVRRAALRQTRRMAPQTEADSAGQPADPTADTTLAALTTLTPRQRECLVLAEVAGVPEETIARALGITPELAKRHVRAASRRFTEAHARLSAAAVAAAAEPVTLVAAPPLLFGGAIHGLDR